MESCFSADTPPLSGIHIKQLSPHLYMALFPQIIITPLSDTYSFSTIPPLYDTIFYILRGYYPTFICGFTAASVPTFIWHFFITSHTDTCSAEGIFYTHLYMTLILFITHRQYYSPQLFRGGFSHHFLLSTGSFSHLSLAFLQIITF